MLPPGHGVWHVVLLARHVHHPIPPAQGLSPRIFSRGLWQYFWDRWNPIPVLLQSVPRVVVLPGSKGLMPAMITMRILSLQALKAVLGSSPHRSVHFSPTRAVALICTYAGS